MDASAQPVSRWDNRNAFRYDDDLCDTKEIKKSIASCMNYNAAAMHDYIMDSDRSKWIKIPSIMLVDAALLATAPIVSVVEAVVCLAIAIITTPALFGMVCTNKEWTVTSAKFVGLAVYSIVQIPNTLYTIYQTFTAESSFSPYNDGQAIMDTISDDIKLETPAISLSATLHIFIANIISAVQDFEAYSLFKAITILTLDATLCLTVPILAVAEAAVRLAVAIITSPLALAYCCFDSELYQIPLMAAMTSLYALCQIPNTLYTVYLSFCGDGSRIEADDNGEKFFCFK